MAGFKRHIFVCLNEREASDPLGCCKHRGAEKIFSFLKAGTAKHRLQDTVRVNRAGCLDHCEYGPAVVIYPEGVWYRIQDIDDAKEVLENHILNGYVVSRLLINNLATQETSTPKEA